MKAVNGRRHDPVSRRRQDGVSLVIVLVLLVATSLLGIAILRSSAMQERMSANMRDRSIAFQAAEAAIRYAQSRLDAVQPPGQSWHQITNPANVNAAITTNNFCDVEGICRTGSAASWRSVPATEYDSARLPAAPEYWIEYLGVGPSVIDSGTCSVDIETVNCSNPMFRITARSRAVGRADVVLQTNVISRIPDPEI